MSMTLWIVALLTLSLPTDYQLTGSTTEKVTRDGFQAKNEFRSWKSADGKAVVLSSWTPQPLRDGGPAVFSNEWPFEVAGQTVEVLEASVFMGIRQDVFATHLKFTNPESTVLIYGKGFSQEEFKALLRNVNVRVTP